MYCNAIHAFMRAFTCVEQSLTCTVCLSVSLLGEAPFFLNRLDSECRPLLSDSLRPDSTLTSPARGPGNSGVEPAGWTANACLAMGQVAQHARLVG